MNLLFEAICVGIGTAIMGFLVSSIIGLFSKNNKSSGDWNKYYVMEIALFFTGFCLHLGCEFTGINKWYCKHGNACSK